MGDMSWLLGHRVRHFYAWMLKIAKLVVDFGKLVRCVPLGGFAAGNAGKPPDYGDLGSWIAHPSQAPRMDPVEDANHVAHEAADLPPPRSRPCDCFFAVDSCYTPDLCTPFVPGNATSRWNLPLGEQGEDVEPLCAKVVESMRMRTAAGASCFNRTCRVYAPKYRQVHVLGLLHMMETARTSGPRGGMVLPGAKPRELTQALDLAYGDLRRAFVAFVDDPANADRPFIVAGHSQGTFHLVRLLQEEIEGHPKRLARFVHGYLTGWAVPMDLFSHGLRSITPSACSSDVCSVSGWRTVADHHVDLTFLRAASYYAGEGWRPSTGPFLINNPVSWSAHGEVSSPASYLGAMWPWPANMGPGEARATRPSGWLPSGVALRFGEATARSRQPLGAQLRELTEVDCGVVTPFAAEDGTLRIRPFPRGCFFSATEYDWMLYHDVDLAMFHGNLQENVAERMTRWSASRRHSLPRLLGKVEGAAAPQSRAKK